MKQCKITFEDAAWTGISKEAKDMISEMMQFEPENRKPSKELVQQWAWLASNNEANISPVN